MQEDHHELQHLYDSQISFPPKIFLHMRTNCREHVISVHDDMNSRIYKAEECSVTFKRVKINRKVQMVTLQFY